MVAQSGLWYVRAREGAKCRGCVGIFPFVGKSQLAGNRAICFVGNQKKAKGQGQLGRRNSAGCRIGTRTGDPDRHNCRGRASRRRSTAACVPPLRRACACVVRGQTGRPRAAYMGGADRPTMTSSCERHIYKTDYLLLIINSTKHLLLIIEKRVAATRDWLVSPGSADVVDRSPCWPRSPSFHSARVPSEHHRRAPWGAEKLR